MPDRTTVGGVVELLAAPELLVAAASSPAVRTTLQVLLNQVNDEIATLLPLLGQPEAAERDRLTEGLHGRERIAARLREILASCTTAKAPDTFRITR